MIESHDQEIFLEIFRQNWQDVRHLENERLTFTEFYGLVVTGVLAFMAQASTIKPFALLLFLSIFSLLGFAISLRLGAAISSVENKIKEARDKMPDELRSLVVFGGEYGWTTKIRLRLIFPALYVITFTLLVFLLFTS